MTRLKRSIIIAAVAANGVIGKDNDIPWRGKLEGDLPRFKKLTEGHIVIMGRRTWDSIPFKYRPLPNRTNIVVTSSPLNTKLTLPPQARTATSVADAINISMLYDGDIFFIGGSGIYIEALKYANYLFLSELDESFEGDTYFPEFDRELFSKIERGHSYNKTPEFPHAYTYNLYRRKSHD